IHSLLAASHEIIHTLYRRKGLHDLLFDSDMIKDEHRQDWAKKLKEAPNFFKHAREDPDGVIDFNPEGNMYLILFLLTGIRRMNITWEFEYRVFTLWLFANKPDLVKDGANSLPIEQRQNLAALSKQQFIKECEASRARTGGIFRL